ncbi:MAG: sigma-70 family RNA polymerase sigma factor [Burkholderiaceae bacterium]
MAVPAFDYETRLIACAQSDQSAFQELYKHESSHMLALCTKMLSQRADAEEIVRDAFVLIWKNASNYDSKMGTARAWMYSIMRYRVLNRLRQSGRITPADSEWVDTLPDAVVSDNTDQTMGLTQCVAKLDDAQRRPILMAFYNGFTYDQIAARLKTPAAEVKADVRAGLNSIRELAQA